MRKRICILLPVLVVIGLAVGCGDDDTSKPSVTRLYVSEDCGVAPMLVDFRGDAAGGEPLSEPSGTNTWLKFTWDFGDGTIIDDGTSVAYHRYDSVGLFTATLTVEDDAGERASRSVLIDVRQDSLVIDAFSRVGDLVMEEVKTCEPVTFDITVEACDFDPVNDNTDRYVHRWTVFGTDEDGTTTTTTYRAPRPVHFYGTTDVGVQSITLQLEDPVRSITREDSLTVVVVESGGADLSLAANWSLTDPEATEAVFERPLPTFPDTLTVSYVLTNDGPERAYRLETEGELDGFNRIFHLQGQVDHGSYTFDGNAADTWRWYIDELAPGTSARLDITFLLEQANPGTDYDFPAATAPYACDPDDDDITVTAVLEIINR